MPGPLAFLRGVGEIVKSKSSSGANVGKVISKDIGVNDVTSGYMKRNLDNSSKTPFGISNKTRHRSLGTLNSEGKPTIFSGGKAPASFGEVLEPKNRVTIIRKNVNRGDKQARTYDVNDRDLDLIFQDPKGFMEQMGDFTESDPDAVEHQFEVVINT